MSGTDPNTPVQTPPPGVVSDFDHPISDSRRALFIATTVILMALSTLAVVARIFARTIVVRSVGWDDALAIIALALNIGLAVSFFAQFNVGLLFIGWNIRETDFYDNYFNGWIMWNTIFTLLLYTILPVIKLSILALYLRILGPSDKKHRIGVWVLIGLVIAIMLSTVAALIQECRPPIALFHPWVQATCNISQAIFIAQAALQVLTDFLILLPPIPYAWKLHTDRRRKIAVLLPIVLGLVVTVIGLTRMILLIQELSAPSAAVNLDSWQGAYLAIIEINCAIIAICLPALNQTFRRAVQTAKSYASRHSRGTSSYALGDTSGLGSFGRGRNKQVYTVQLTDEDGEDLSTLNGSYVQRDFQLRDTDDEKASERKVIAVPKSVGLV